MTRIIVLGIVAILEQKDRTLRIIGRCCQDTIKKSDVFMQVYTYNLIDLKAGLPVDPINARPLHLQVIRMEAFQVTLDELSPGWTALIDLEGEGGTMVTKDDFLSN